MGRMSQDESNVVRLDDRALGVCLACEGPIRFADNYIRLRGAPVHLSCALVAARNMRDDARARPAHDWAIPRPDL